MLNPEILKTFDEQRDIFKPYGLTCELWEPTLMSKPDRHNEIELNYFPEGSITYLIQERHVTVPSKRLCVFWGLIPHQIVDYEGKSPYFVSTLPFSLFLEWKLPTPFVDRLLNGQVLVDTAEETSVYDEFLFSKWIDDIEDPDATKLILLEMQARLSRLANKSFKGENANSPKVRQEEISHVEQMAIFIAQNYQKPISISAIGEQVGLHPDYANSIFKKTFGSTLNEYINEERIAHAQRKLMTSKANISEIAYECGFNSISWFNTSFKKINGCTPRQFRKNTGRKDES